MTTKISSEELEALYPNVYSDECCSFEIPIGWYPLIAELSHDINEILKLNPGSSIVCEQVKQKFGGLRFYYSERCLTKYQSDLIKDLVLKTEIKSEAICEETGEKGLQCKKAGWYRTLSKEAAEKLGFEILEERIT